MNEGSERGYRLVAMHIVRMKGCKFFFSLQKRMQIRCWHFLIECRVQHYIIRGFIVHFLRIVGVNFNRPGGSLEPSQTCVASPMVITNVNFEKVAEEMSLLLMTIYEDQHHCRNQIVPLKKNKNCYCC